MAEASSIATPTLITIIVACIVFALFAGLLFMFCRCARNQSKKNGPTKDYEMDSVRPSIVAPQSQGPPPYYSANGLDNKALEHSMDLALDRLEDQKSAVYGTQNGYGYHMNTGLPGHPMAGNECESFIYEFLINICGVLRVFFPYKFWNKFNPSGVHLLGRDDLPLTNYSVVN